MSTAIEARPSGNPAPVAAETSMYRSQQSLPQQEGHSVSQTDRALCRHLSTKGVQSMWLGVLQ